MTNLGDFPKELAHVEVLAKAAHSITLAGKDEGIKDDLTTISHAAREIVDTSEGLVVVARQDYLKALGFIGLSLMGSYFLGYKQALKDLGMNDGNPV